MPSVSQSTSPKSDLNPGTAPDSSAQPLDSSIKSPKGNDLDDLRKSMRAFKDDTVTVAQERLRGAQSNLHSTEKDIHDSNWLGRLSGTTAALEKQQVAEKAMVEQRQAKADELTAQLKKTEVLVKQYDEKLEVIKEYEKKFLEQHAKLDQELKKLEGNEEQYKKKLEEQVKLEGKYSRDLEQLQAEAAVIKESAYKCMSIDPKVDTSAYAASLREVNTNLERGIKTLDNIETGAKVVHTGCVVVAATAITVGTMGAGAGIGGAMIAGTVGGTAIGALGNGVEAGGHVYLGNKTSEQALSDAAGQTLADAKTAAQAAASAAVGGGLANSSAVTSVVGTKVAQYVVAPALVQAGNTAFSTGSEILSARSEYAKFIQSPEFKVAHGGTPAELGQARMEVIRDKFFQDRGLDWGTIAKNGAIDMSVAVGGSLIGARVNTGGAQTITGKVVRMGVEGSSDVVLGTGAALMKGEKLSIETVGQQVQNAAVGRAVSFSVGTVQTSKAPKADGTAQKNYEVTPEGAGFYRRTVDGLNAKVINGTAEAVSTVGLEKAAINQVKLAGASAKDYAGEKIQQGVNTAKEKVREGLNTAMAKGRELVSGARGNETPAPDAAPAAKPTETKTAETKPAETKTAAASAPAAEPEIPEKPYFVKKREREIISDLDAVKAAAIEHQQSGKAGPFKVTVSNVEDLVQVTKLKRAMPDGAIDIKATKDFIEQIKAARGKVDSGTHTDQDQKLAAIKITGTVRAVAGTAEEAKIALAYARTSLEKGAPRVELKIESPEVFKQNIAELRKMSKNPEFQGRLRISGTKDVIDFVKESKATMADPTKALAADSHQEGAARWRTTPSQSERAVFKTNPGDDTQVAGAATSTTRNDARRFDKADKVVPNSRGAAKTKNTTDTEAVTEQA